MIVFASFDDQLFHSVILCSGHVVNNPTLPRFFFPFYHTSIRLSIAYEVSDQ